MRSIICNVVFLLRTIYFWIFSMALLVFLVIEHEANSKTKAIKISSRTIKN